MQKVHKAFPIQINQYIFSHQTINLATSATSITFTFHSSIVGNVKSVHHYASSTILAALIIQSTWLFFPNCCQSVPKETSLALIVCIWIQNVLAFLISKNDKKKSFLNYQNISRSSNCAKLWYWKFSKIFQIVTTKSHEIWEFHEIFLFKFVPGTHEVGVLINLLSLRNASFSAKNIKLSVI